ncbi:MAG: heparan-alpha-glucosaminide N-acetyltransferase domain-containing protein [Promethearchaeota archaeon]
MERIKSIDAMRGLSIVYMLFGHFLQWWIIAEDYWAYVLLRILFEPLGSSAFIFIAGVSTSISYHSRMKKLDELDFEKIKRIKHEYLNKGILILLIGLAYNFFVALSIGRFADVWKYFVLITIGISLIIAWPLLKISKIMRCAIGIIIWISHYFTLSYLIQYQGQSNLQGILFHALYNSLDLDPLICFFTFFLIGTVIGDILHETMEINYPELRKVNIALKLTLPSLISGMLLIVFGITFQYPTFLQHRTFPWFFYALGCILILFSTLITLEINQFIYKKERFKFLYYFSYYSLTLYLAHNLFYFLFLGQLTFMEYLLFSSITVISLRFLLKFAHDKVGKKFSLKFLISFLSSELSDITMNFSLKNTIISLFNDKTAKT